MEDETLAKKSLGQHWLKDPKTLEAMCDAVELSKNDTVLEIGSGLGTLTAELVARAKKVIAVELDRELAQILNTKFNDKNLTIIEKDILNFNLKELPPNYKIAANIPYYLTSKLLRTLCETDNSFTIAALLVQKEVAERVAAKPGAMGILSVSVQYYCEVKLGEIVPAALFTPPPKVDSQILILKRRTPLPYGSIDTRQFFRIVKAGFSQRRKTLLNSLSSGLRISKEDALTAIKKADLNTNDRPQVLSVDDWHNLYLAFQDSSLPF